MEYSSWLLGSTDHLVITGEHGVECHAKPKKEIPFNWDNIDNVYEATQSGMEVGSDIEEYLSVEEMDELFDAGITISGLEFVVSCKGCGAEISLWDEPSTIAGRDTDFDTCGDGSCSASRYAAGL